MSKQPQYMISRIESLLYKLGKGPAMLEGLKEVQYPHSFTKEKLTAEEVHKVWKLYLDSHVVDELEQILKAMNGDKEASYYLKEKNP